MLKNVNSQPLLTGPTDGRLDQDQTKEAKRPLLRDRWRWVRGRCPYAIAISTQTIFNGYVSATPGPNGQAVEISEL